MRTWSLVIVLLISFTLVSAQEESDMPMNGKMKPVLIIIDTQNQFMHYMDQADSKIALEMINWSIVTFRSYGFPIIRVYHTDPQNGPSTDRKEFQFVESLQINEKDPMIVKNYPNAFKKTDLDKVLKEMGANTLFLCGLSSVGCVIATYHGAKDNDYDVVLLENALMCHDHSQTQSIEKIFDSVNFTVMNMMLKYAKTE